MLTLSAVCPSMVEWTTIETMQRRVLMNTALNTYDKQAQVRCTLTMTQVQELIVNDSCFSPFKHPLSRLNWISGFPLSLLSPLIPEEHLEIRGTGSLQSDTRPATQPPVSKQYRKLKTLHSHYSCHNFQHWSVIYRVSKTAGTEWKQWLVLFVADTKWLLVSVSLSDVHQSKSCTFLI